MIAYLDCFSGASGDMILAALIDAGADLGAVEAQLSTLGLPFELTFTTVHRCGLRACRVEVSAPDGTWGVMRTYADGLRLIEGADLDPVVAGRAVAILGRLARAEAQVHGATAPDVHFHELDGVDTIVDVVGSAAAFASLEAGEPSPRRGERGAGPDQGEPGSARVVSSPVATGVGVVPSRHGPLPLPAPAVLELLGGGALYGRSIEAELITPTGAAILAEYAESFGKMPPMTVSSVGYGAGTRELEIPNVLRVVLGEPVGSSRSDPPEGVEDLLIETTLDDLNPELFPYVIERLSAAGAIDAWVVPVIGKAGRPAQVLQVLAPPHAEEAIRDTFIAETSTLGVRVSSVRRYMLPRRWLEVLVGDRPVRVKVAMHEEAPVNVAPEYADCAEAARALGVPLKEVYRAALAAAAELL